MKEKIKMSNRNEETNKEQLPESEKVDGDDFLKELRAAGTFQNQSSTNEDTIGASNTQNHRSNLSSLSELFDSPKAPPSASVLPPPKFSLPSAPSPSSIPKDTTVSFSGVWSDGAGRNAAGNKVVSPPRTMPPRPPSVNEHSRGVSWGKTVDLERPKSRRDIHQPSLDTHSPRSPGSRITIDDVLKASPFEAEVETNILRAIDNRQQSFRHRPRSDTGTSSILTQVPDDTNHEFDLSSPMSTSMDENDDMEPINDQEEDHAPHSSRSRRGSITREQSRPLIQSSRHRRGQSVENTLFDLTAAMTALHGSKHDSHRHHHHSEPRPEPATAEDFAHNVVRISEQQQQEAKPSLWSKITNNLPTLRENSGMDTSEGDSSDETQHDVETAAPATTPTTTATSDSFHSPRKKNRKNVLKETNDRIKDDWEVWNGFFRPRRERVLTYVKVVLLYIMVPMTGIAAILYYLVGNPPTGEAEEGITDTDTASASWIMLFCCRQIITLSLALTVQFFVIDFLALDTRVMLTIVGPIITLLIVQSKGWPFIFFFWSIFDFAMLSGGSTFAHHWGYWQSAIRLFNERNPSGHVVDNDWYIRILIVTVSVSAVVAVKRFLIGLYLGRQTFSHFGQQLAAVMNKMLLVSEVAGLAKEIERNAMLQESSSRGPSGAFGLKHQETLRRIDYAQGDDDDNTTTTLRSPGSIDNVIDMNKRDPLTGSLHNSERMKLMQLLERWEEPERRDAHASNEIASISAVLRFRKALTFIQKRYPFSHAFGPADTREACIDSAQKVYSRLLRGTGEHVLQFETIALLALDDAGNINQDKAKDLVKLFRPDRQGNLSMLDFVKSCDAVYKEFRLLGASIENSSQIDRAFERMFNVIFYIIVATIVLSQLGFDPLALFLSLSSVILAFAFIIGSASAKYFEGVLFILARRPYGIGDMIQVGGVETNASLDGALPWVVENVTLYETIVKHLPTNEQASLSNGSLAASRIINWARSPQAQFHIFLKFPLDTPYEKIVIFKSAIEEYMKARPREWRALNGFRATKVMADANYVEYIIVIQHREAWQQVGQVLDSKANLTSYCQEVTKQLNMHYQAPRVPVDLKYTRADPEQPTFHGDDLNTDQLTQSFQSLARNKHNIRVC